MSKVIQFIRESRAELKKVVWPTKEDVLSSIKVVLISTIIIAVILGALDLGFSELFRIVMRQDGSNVKKLVYSSYLYRL